MIKESVNKLVIGERLSTQSTGVEHQHFHMIVFRIAVYPKKLVIFFFDHINHGNDY